MLAQPGLEKTENCALKREVIMSSILKKMAKNRKFKSVPIDHPLRAQHVYGCLAKLVCPDCGHKIGEIFEIDGSPLSKDEIGCACPSCGWQSVFGGC